MARPSLGAIEAGIDYQERFFWYQSARLLRSKSHVKKVRFEMGPNGFDDLQVFYEPSISKSGRSILAQYYQFKWHQRTNRSIGYSDLASTKFIGTKTTTILRNILRYYKEAECKPDQSEYLFVTPWSIKHDDPLAKIVGCNNGEVLFEGLLSASARSKLGKVRELWKADLAITSNDDLQRVLTPFRIKAGGLDFEDLQNILSDRMEICGLIPIDPAKNADIYSSHYRALLKQGTLEFTADSFSEYCSEQGLLSDNEIKSTSCKDAEVCIGVRTFLPLTDDMEDDASDFICLSHLFRDRYINDQHQWNDNIRTAIPGFLTKYKGSADPIRVFLNTHSSIAFLCGDVFGNKLRSPITISQRTMGKTVNWSSISDAPAEPDVILETEGHDEECSEILLGLSLTQDVKSQVLTFAKQNDLRFAHAVWIVPESGPGGSSVRNGAHAYAIAQRVSNYVRSLTTQSSPDKPTKVHLFAAAPNAVMFMLGQFRRAIGPTQLYEFDFDGFGNRAYSPSLLLE